GTTVNGGTLSVASTGSLPSGTNLTTSGTVQFNNAAQTVGSLSGTGAVTVAGGSTLSITGGGAFAGAMNVSGAVNFPGNASSTAAATRTLGALNISSGGKVKVNASIDAVTPMALQPAALTLSGTIDLTNNILIA